MPIGIGVGVGIQFGGGDGVAVPATSLITSVDVDGWQVVYPSPPAEFDPVGDPKTISVKRNGFTALGVATTVTDILIIMKRVRDPYPDENDLTATKASASEYVYLSDIVDSAVATNNSTRVYPKPQAMWLSADYEITDDGLIDFKLLVTHPHARNGTPVAAVKFIASDGVNTDVETIVSVMSKEVHSTSGLNSSIFKTNMDITSLDAGAVTRDVIIYPWVGAAFQASVDGETAPTIKFGTQTIVNNKSLARPRIYARVDGVGGSSAVSTTRSTALTTPYASINAALVGIDAYNLANHGTAEADYGIIMLDTGTYDTGDMNAASASTLAPLTIEAVDVADKATTIATSPTFSGELIPRLIVKDLTIDILAATRSYSWGSGNAAGNAAMLKLDNIDITQGSNVFEDTVFGQSNRLYCFGVTGADAYNNSGRGVFTYFSSASKQVNLIDCQGNFDGCNAVYGCVGVKGNLYLNDTKGTGITAKEGSIIAFNKLRLGTGTAAIVDIGALETGVKGYAVVGCVLESYGSHSGQTLYVHADGNTVPSQNLVIMSNSFTGGRVNYNYLTVGSNVAKSGYVRNNVFDKYNSKGDVQQSDGTLIDNWSVIYKVGHSYNVSARDSNTGLVVGTPGAWGGEVLGIGELFGSDATPIVLDYTNDQSNTGGDAGDGDYTPGASTAIVTIPVNLTVHSHDLNGTVYDNDGTDYIGAIVGAVVLTFNFSMFISSQYITLV